MVVENFRESFKLGTIKQTKGHNNKYSTFYQNEGGVLGEHLRISLAKGEMTATTMNDSQPVVMAAVERHELTSKNNYHLSSAGNVI